MTTLATLDDYETITGSTVASDDQARITRLLELASDAILAGSHGQTIVRATSTDATIRPRDGFARLPQRPVVDVASVTADGTILASDDYRWTAGESRRPALLIRQVDGVDAPWNAAELTVTYTHGYDPVPGQIIAATVMMAAGVARNDGGPAEVQTSTGPFSTTYLRTDVQSSTMTLTGPTRSLLDAMFGVDRAADVVIRAAV